MKKIYLLLLFFPLLANAQTLPVISVSGGPCAGDTLIVTSSIKAARIVWKQNSTVVQTDNATWLAADTMAGGNGSGSGLDQFDGPQWPFVDTVGNLYIPDYNNDRVVKWAPGATTGVLVAGGNGAGSALNQTSSPSGLWVDSAGNVFTSEYDNDRVTKWAPGATTGIVVAGGNGPGTGANQLEAVQGIYMDKQDTLYIADFNNSRIQKWAPGATTGITVAGGNGSGNAANQLSYPEGVCLDKNRNIFIADWTNYRVQEWAPGATSGTTIAGNGTQGTGTNQTFADDVKADGLGNVYVCDFEGKRIQQWAAGASTGTTVAVSTGTAPITTPIGICLDRSGNLYLSDYYNNYVLKYPDTIVNSYIVPASGSYSVTVYDFNGDSVTQVVTAPVPADSITVSPSATVTAGTLVTFSSTETNGGNSPTYQWYINGHAVSGATNSTYSFNAFMVGDTATLVMHSSDACTAPDSAISNAIVIYIYEGVPQILAGNTSISFYPNPNTGSFTISGTSDKDITASVINMVGQVMYSKNITVNNGSINSKVNLGNDLPEGIYLLRIQTASATSTAQFVIRR